MTNETEQREGLNLSDLLKQIEEIRDKVTDERERLDCKPTEIKILLAELKRSNCKVSHSFNKVVEEGYRTWLGYGSSDTYVTRYHTMVLTYDPANADILTFECGKREKWYNPYDSRLCSEGNNLIDSYKFAVPFAGNREIAKIIKTNWLRTLIEKAKEINGEKSE